MGDAAKSSFLSLKEFAAAVGVTEVAVLSDCRGLGLGGYIELKKELQTHMLIRFPPIDRFKLAVSGSGSVSSLYSIKKMARAKRVYIVAHDASCLIARYFIHRMIPLGLDVYELDRQDRHQTFYRLVSEPPRCCILIPITVPPYGQGTMAVTRYCQSLGMGIAAITDRRISPVALCADVSLICHTELMGLTNSYTSIMSVINVLAMLYAFMEEDQDPEREAELSRMSDEYERHFPEYPKFNK